jgi:hypothetical protein
MKSTPATFKDFRKLPPKAGKESAARAGYSQKMIIMSSSTREANQTFKENVSANNKSDMLITSTVIDTSLVGATILADQVLEASLPAVNPVSTKRRLNRARKYMDFINSQAKTHASIDLKEIVNDIPKVTAKSWVAIEVETKKILFGYKVNTKREVASLTKLMTLYTALDICRERNIDPETFSCKVSKYSSSMIGTSANLKADDCLSLKDLFHGTIRLLRLDVAFRKRCSAVYRRESRQGTPDAHGSSQV